jgi:hypothetical protein
MKDGAISDLEIVGLLGDIDIQWFAFTEKIEPHWRETIEYVQHKSQYHFESYHYAYESEESVSET